MQKSLLDLKHEIMTSSNTAEDWIRLDREVDEAIQRASEEDVQKFVDSGAGEIVVNSIDTDGVKKGFDREMLRAVRSSLPTPLSM